MTQVTFDVSNIWKIEHKHVLQDEKADVLKLFTCIDK